MKKTATLVIFCFILINSISAQMWNGLDTLYGNEWINYDQSYYKIKIANDGIYRITHQLLVDEGIPVNDIEGNSLKLFYMGKEQPIFVSTESSFGINDFIEFVGKKNRGDLDRYLFTDPDAEMANPDYSIFTDTSAYFLTWGNEPSEKRYNSVVNDLDNAPTTPESFCFYTSSEIFTDEHTKKRYPGGIWHADFGMSEGFVGVKKLNQTITMSCDGIIASGPESKLSTRTVVTNHSDQNVTHQQVVKLNGNVLIQDDFTNAKTLQNDFNIATSTLGESNEVRFEGLFNGNDRQKVASVKITYPRVFDFGGLGYFEFSMPVSNNTQLLEIANFGIGSTNPILLDLTNNIRIETTVSGDIVKVALPASSIERNLILVNVESNVLFIDNIQPVEFVDYFQEEGNYIIISNQRLYEDPQSGTNWVEEYANYRRSSDGQSFDVTVVDVQQLYDQFAYGINRHSLSIRNFGHFIKKEWTNPQYVFLIGKGLSYWAFRKEGEVSEALANGLFHVPTFGGPGGADNLLFSTNEINYPMFSVGRLAAKTPNEVRIYLDKVIAQEAIQNSPQTIEDRSWRKQILHLGGGNSSEQPRFKTYLNGFESIIENNAFGGEVTSFYKTTSDPVQISISDQLTDLINGGVSVMTLFGHASGTGFDFTIDNAAAYDNEGRFPVMVSLGCFSGRIHGQAIGVSEEFILTEKKGAIAFFASTGLSLETSLRRFGNEFYQQLGETHYGEGIGDIGRHTLMNVSNSIGYLTGVITLHGDPAIRVMVGDGPDYLIDSDEVKFSPNPINVRVDSFDLKFDIVNLGQTQSKKVSLEITQELPNGAQQKLVTDSIAAPPFRSSYNYTLPSLGNQALGANKFFIELDNDNLIVELPAPDAEQNNKLVNSSGAEGVEVYFISNEIIPVSPKEYSIVNNPNLTLKASTSSPFLESQQYIFEIDTTILFDSPLAKRQEITQSGGVVKWKPNIPFQNNTVYYWRVSPDEDPNIGGYVWRNSSFLYQTDLGNGWNQSHYFQFKENDYTNMELEDDRTLQFIKDFKDFKLENLAVYPPFDFVTKITINNDRSGWYYGNPNAAVAIAVLDSVNIDPWINTSANQNLYGSINYWPSNLEWFPFRVNNTNQREKVINFLENEIPNGNYVAFLTLMEQGYSFKPEEWGSDTTTLGTSIYDVLESQGATQVRDLESGARPYIFFYKKGQNVVNELIANNVDEKIQFSVGIPGNWDEGYLESTIIGPAQTWESLKWQTSSLDNIPTDEFYIDVIGIDNNGNDSLLYHQVITTDTSLSQIDAQEFPYLKLRFNSRDSIQRTTVQLDYWRVLFQGLPEVALNPSVQFSFSNDTLSQGEKLNMNVAIENIGQYDMDSILVKFSITDQANNQTDIFKRFRPLPEGDTLIARLNYDTYNFANKNTFQVEVNPDKDQPEEFSFNNVGFFDFFVETDQRNPLLDVTFDGIHIMDGDLISSKPGIVISLKDENQFLTLDDPSLIKVFLKSPNEPELRRIFVDGDTLSFSPANGSENKSQFLFQPQLTVDGTYYLIVQAEDRSGNQSGSLDFKVSFEVKNQSSITNVLNYPNPFSTSTRFVFTVTGSEIPEDMKIQILTVSGRIVREIRQEELGNIHIGNNITNYAWDGTDEYGQKLANGVYLYRVISKKSNNEEFEHLNTRSDRFFKNGFGKMVILR